MTTAQGPSHDHDVPYGEEDLGEVDSPHFTQRAASDGAGVIVAGPCPRCHGRTETLFPWGIPGTGGKGPLPRLMRPLSASLRRTAVEPPDPMSHEVHFCECGHAHPQLPPDTSYRGCGASWRIRR